MRLVTAASTILFTLAGIAPAAPAPRLKVLQDLTEQTGGGPEFPPIIGQNGLLYGTTYTLNNGGALYSIQPDGKTFTILYAFPGGAAGADPFGGLTQGADGTLFGTTLFGGQSAQGTVFQFDIITNTETVVHSFDLADGSAPYSGPVQDADGTLYGATSAGGTNNLGTIYKIAAGSQMFSKLADLDATVGPTPYGPLLVGGDGYLYGTATGFGASSDGTIFRVAIATGRSERLYRFAGSDGANPVAGLTAGPSGMLYGTTDSGGANQDGVLFAFALKGRKLTVLHHFAGTDGQGPQGGVTLDHSGRLLGTTYTGGAYNGGVIYQYDPATSSFRVLLNLIAGTAGLPNAGLTYAGGKLFYGATLSGGTSTFAAGTIFKFNE